MAATPRGKGATSQSRCPYGAGRRRPALWRRNLKAGKAPIGSQIGLRIGDRRRQTLANIVAKTGFAPEIEPFSMMLIRGEFMENPPFRANGTFTANT